MTAATSIPRTLHYCWYGAAPLSELGQRCVRTWRDAMPDYEIRCWDEGGLCSTSPYVVLAHRLKKYAFVADYMRCFALHRDGGVYLDTDVEVLRPFDGLLRHELFLGLQAPASVGVGVIGAVPGHPLLKLVMDTLDDEARSGKASFQPLPELVSALIGARGGHGDHALLPEDYFYPYNPYSPDPVRRKPLQCNMSANTVCVHHWEGTWLGDMSLRMMLRLRAKQWLGRWKPGSRKLDLEPSRGT